MLCKSGWDTQERRRRTRSIAALFVAALLCAVLGMQAAPAPRESGSYQIYNGSEQVGDEQFAFTKLDAGRRLVTSTRYRAGGRNIDQKVSLDLDASDRPVRIQVQDTRGSTTATFDDSQIEVTGVSKSERPWPRDFMLRYPNTFHHVALILAHAPQSEKGSSAYAETFSGAPVLVLNKGIDTVESGEKPREFRRYWLIVRGERSVAWTDASTGELIKYELPSAGLVVIATGSETIAASLIDKPPARK